MAACDFGRALAAASIVIALALGVLAYWHVVFVAFVERTLSLLFAPAETAALSRIVPSEQMSVAIASNDARENAAGIVGPLLGGALFGFARAAPFAVNAFSYLVSLVTVVALKTPLAAEPRRRRQPMRVEVADGVKFLWRIPFIRATALQAMGTNVTWSATTLTIVVVARRGGASGSEIGAMLAIVGIGGVVGSAASGYLLRRLSGPAVVLGAVWCWAGLIASLLLTRNPFVLGAILGLALSLGPAWNGVAVGIRIRLTPDELQGRVHAVEALLSFGARPFSVLAVGFLLDDVGGHTTITVISAWTLIIAFLSTLSPSLRRMPELALRDEVDAAPAIPNSDLDQASGVNEFGARPNTRVASNTRHR